MVQVRLHHAGACECDFDEEQINQAFLDFLSLEPISDRVTVVGNLHEGEHVALAYLRHHLHGFCHSKECIMVAFVRIIQKCKELFPNNEAIAVSKIQVGFVGLNTTLLVHIAALN